MSNGEADRPPYPITPDGRYFVVRGRLWRRANPALLPALRTELVASLMAARRAVGAAQRRQDADEETQARATIDRVKRELGERGPPWWEDGAPDFNRHLARNTPYADWYAHLDTPAPARPVAETAGTGVT